MFAKGSWTKVPIDIDGSDPHLCANACKWHRKDEVYCDLFDEFLDREELQTEYTRCMECLAGQTA